MTDNETSGIKIWNEAAMAFYTDFMPMIQKIKYNLSILDFFKDRKSQEYIINGISIEIAKAEALLNQLKRFSDNYGAKE